MFIRSRVVKRATTLKKIRTKREGKEEDAMFARQGLISMCEIFNFVAPLFKDKRPVLFVYIDTANTKERPAPFQLLRSIAQCLRANSPSFYNLTPARPIYPRTRSNLTS